MSRGPRGGAPLDLRLLGARCCRLGRGRGRSGRCGHAGAGGRGRRGRGRRLAGLASSSRAAPGRSGRGPRRCCTGRDPAQLRRPAGSAHRGPGRAAGRLQGGRACGPRRLHRPRRATSPGRRPDRHPAGPAGRGGRREAHGHTSPHRSSSSPTGGGNTCAGGRRWRCEARSGRPRTATTSSRCSAPVVFRPPCARAGGSCAVPSASAPACATLPARCPTTRGVSSRPSSSATRRGHRRTSPRPCSPPA